jgi:hypothetical protein
MRQKVELLEEEKFVEEERRRKRDESKDKKKVSKGKEKGEKESDAKTYTNESQRLIVPIIKLKDVGKFQLAAVKLDKKIPGIKKRKRRFIIPVIKLERHSPSLRKMKVDTRIVHIEKRERIQRLPIIQMMSLQNITLVVPKLDTKIIELSGRGNVHHLEVPAQGQSVSELTQISPKEIDKASAEKIQQRLQPGEEDEETGKKEDLKVDIQEKNSISSGGTSPPTGGEKEELPDFLDFAFGSEGGKLRDGNPKIILFKDVEDNSYIQFLEEICKRIYREIRGGMPKAKKIECPDDINEMEIKSWLKAGNHISTIEGKVIVENASTDKHFQERLKEIPSQDLGFVIIRAQTEDDFNKLENDLLCIDLSAQGKLPIIKLRARELPLGIIKLLSGMLDPKEYAQLCVTFDQSNNKIYFKQGRPTFDMIANMMCFAQDSLFNNKLKNIKENNNQLFSYVTNRSKDSESDNENESALHFDIKVFLVWYLAHKKLKVEDQRQPDKIKEKIKTEEELDGIRPDVMIEKENSREVYEIETLFSAGPDPENKIKESIHKYDGLLNENDKVNIVMDNFGFLLHLKDLHYLKRNLEKDKIEFGVEFYTVDLKNNRLVSLDEFTEKFKQLVKSASKENGKKDEDISIGP